MHDVRGPRRKAAAVRLRAVWHLRVYRVFRRTSRVSIQGEVHRELAVQGRRGGADARGGKRRRASAVLGGVVRHGKRTHVSDGGEHQTRAVAKLHSACFRGGTIQGTKSGAGAGGSGARAAAAGHTALKFWRFPSPWTAVHAASTGTDAVSTASTGAASVSTAAGADARAGVCGSLWTRRVRDTGAGERGVAALSGVRCHRTNFSDRGRADACAKWGVRGG